MPPPPATTTTAAAAPSSSAERAFCDLLDDAADAPGQAAPSTTPETVREQLVGRWQQFPTPFGPRRITYADWTASGRSLASIESFLVSRVLPFYANTHTTADITGQQSTGFRQESRNLIRQALHATIEDVLLFTGSGATAAILRLISVLGLDKPLSTPERPVVFVSSTAHHSNLLPWREASVEVVTVPADAAGRIDAGALAALLAEYAGRPLRIGSFSAASNVTGLLDNVDQITALLHRNGALAFWDYASAAPYVEVDMNPVVDGADAPYVYKDAVFISPHKFVGGPGTPGILLAKKRLFSNAVPTQPGGGTVFFVTDRDHRYLSNRVEREEGGTPDIVGSIRAGLVFQLKRTVGSDVIDAHESRWVQRAMARWTQHPNIVVLGPTDATARRLPILSFMVKHAGRFLHYNYVCALLNDVFGIQSRGGCVCAGPYGLALLGIKYDLAKRIETELVEQKNEIVRPGFTRVSFNYFISEAEADYIIAAVEMIADLGWKLLGQYRLNHKTGEVKHHSRTKFLERLWISDIDFAQSEFEPAAAGLVPEADRDEPALFASYLDAAQGVFANPTSATQKSHVSALEDESLRWYAIAGDAAAAGASPDAWAAPFEGLGLRGNPTPAKPSACDEAAAAAAEAEAEAEAAATAGEEEDNPFAFFGDDDDDDDDDEDSTKAARKKKEKYPLRQADAAGPSLTKPVDAVALTQRDRDATLWPKVPPKIMKAAGKAVYDWGMLKPGDRVLVGLSGGKDSLALLHTLHAIQRKSAFKFEIAAATVDPGHEMFDPRPLIGYMKQLEVPYYLLTERIFDQAGESMDGNSICSFCARLKRGTLYTCAKEEGYNVLALGQHLDDLAETFMMSAFFNGVLRTMHASYVSEKGVRVIRPLVYLRERTLKEFSYTSRLPVIQDNCPACFSAPQERARIKKVLAKEEALFPNVFDSLRRALLPLMDKTAQKELSRVGEASIEAHRQAKADLDAAREAEQKQKQQQEKQ